MKYAMSLFLALLVGLASPAQAVTRFVNANVVRTLVADQERFGGCMAKLDQDMASLGLDCASGWVSFSCTGTFTTKDVAYRMFDSAQMAFALGRPVNVQVDDTKKHNGHCYARRIEVLP